MDTNAWINTHTGKKFLNIYIPAIKSNAPHPRRKLLSPPLIETNSRFETMPVNGSSIPAVQ
jgi:hypothetical protein